MTGKTCVEKQTDTKNKAESTETVKQKISLCEKKHKQSSVFFTLKMLVYKQYERDARQCRGGDLAIESSWRKIAL